MTSPAEAGTPRRGRAYNPVIRRLQGAATSLHALALKATGGRFLQTIGPNKMVVLTTTGRKSGKPRAVPLFAYRDGDSWIVVASNGGTAGHPAWFHNLQAAPEGKLRVKNEELEVRASVLDESERAVWWPRVVSKYRLYESYQRKTDREIPLVRLAPAD